MINGIIDGDINKDRVTNAEILERVGEKRSLSKMVMKRKMQYFGHLVRAGGLQKLFIDWKSGRDQKARAQR